MTSIPLVSVVTSVYNAERYLRESIESILSQSGADFEFILIDDGSTDGSGPILDDCARRDSRARVIRQENQGLTRALIRGCGEARGEYIARHDPDDLSAPNRLARQAALLDADSSLSMASCWSRAIGPEGEVLFETRRPVDKVEAARQLLFEFTGPPGHGSVMFRKSAYDWSGGYREQFYFAQDSDLWLRLGEIGGIQYEPAVLYEYRVAERGVSSEFRELQHRFGELAHESQTARAAGRSEASILQEAAALEKRCRQTVPSRYGSAGASFIAKCLLARGDPRALVYFKKALRISPWSPKLWAGCAIAGLRSAFSR